MCNSLLTEDVAIRLRISRSQSIESCIYIETSTTHMAIYQYRHTYSERAILTADTAVLIDGVK